MSRSTFVLGLVGALALACASCRERSHSTMRVRGGRAVTLKLSNAWPSVDEEVRVELRMLRREVHGQMVAFDFGDGRQVVRPFDAPRDAHSDLRVAGATVSWPYHGHYGVVAHLHAATSSQTAMRVGPAYVVVHSLARQP